MDTSRDFICVERVNDQPIAIHIVHKPGPCDDGFYRQTVSFDAFRRRQSKHVHKCTRNRQPFDRWFYCDFRTDWEANQARTNKTLTEILGRPWDEFAGVPRIEHTNVWTFYQSIGYDYKRKKFTK